MEEKVQEVQRISEGSITSIKEIILENFMSYEYARIPLKEGLNLIVGPNGAGKSSILLALSVALGQAYTERARRLSDLIRRGKEIARVSIIFDNRPKSGKRPIPYSKSDTFMLSRYLRKDGSYWFEADYREIEKSEVIRLLKQFGINPDNMLIIMHQGMIEEFGALSAQERLKMVEEAVGFSEYRERIIQAENELKGLISEEGSLMQLIDNANQALEYWKQIYDRYLEKKRLIEHRSLLEKELLWSNEAKIIKALNSVREKIEVKRRALDDLKDQHKSIKDESERVKNALADKQVELKKAYYSLVRVEKERARREASVDKSKRIRAELATLSKIINDTINLNGERSAAKIREFSDYLIDKAIREEEEDERRVNELNKEVSALQAEIEKTDELVKRGIENYISLRVKSEVIEYRIKMLESEIRELERSENEYNEELEKLRPELEKAGERIKTERMPYEIIEEIKLVTAQIQKLQDVPSDAEKIYKDYSGSIQELKVKLQKLQENKEVLLQELAERKKVWRDAISKLIDEINPIYQSILASSNAIGFIRLVEGKEIEEAGIQLYVGFGGNAPTVLDPFTQSGGERSVALMAFMLSLQSRIVSPIRAMDEFDIHMDPRNREAIFRMIIEQMKSKGNSQCIVITPSLLTVLDRSTHVITVQAVHGVSEVMELNEGEGRGSKK